MMTIFLTAFLLMTGSIVILLSTIGLLRFPDIFCRAHALSKAMPLGINLILIGAWIYMGHDLVGFKLFLAIIFQMIGLPVAGHLFGNIAFKKNFPRWKHKPVNYHK